MKNIHIRSILVYSGGKLIYTSKSNPVQSNLHLKSHNHDHFRDLCFQKSIIFQV